LTVVEGICTARNQEISMKTRKTRWARKMRQKSQHSQKHNKSTGSMEEYLQGRVSWVPLLKSSEVDERRPNAA